MTTIAEALQSPNVHAFLRAIRLGEGTLDADGYRRIVGGELFASFADHPRKRVWIERYGVWSTAAGAYQFLAGTWDEMRAKYGLRDFSPGEQDKGAIGLLIRRKALDDVLAGRIEAAIAKCRLEWASLPGSPYGQRTESMQRVLDTYIASGGSLAPVPAEAATELVSEAPTPQQIAASPQSIPVEAQPMAPFIAAALPALVQSIPVLIRSFGDGSVTERNAKAAEAVLQIAQTATGAANAQAAVEAVQADPAAREAVTRALEAEHWLEPTEAGGGGIAGAREFNLQASDGDPLRMPALWISILLLIPVYAVVGAVIFGNGWSAEVRIQVVTAVLATMGIVGAFWLGSSFAKSRQQ